MVSLAESIKTKAEEYVQARWLKFDVVLRCSLEVYARCIPEPKEIRQNSLRWSTPPKPQQCL